MDVKRRRFHKQPLTVNLIEPQDGDQITWPDSTVFRAEANDVDGEIVCVSFELEHRDDTGYHGIGFSSHKVGDGWEREYDWDHDGEWTVWAEATDNEGAVGISDKITITVNSP